MSLSATSQIKLPAPAVTGGMPVNEVFNKRHSLREFDSSRTVSPQQLSQLLWSAVGVNRPGQSKLTSPTGLNAQEISAYVLTAEAAYRYDNVANTLEPVAGGDLRGLLASRGEGTPVQEFVNEAPVSIVFVADRSRFPELSDQMAMSLCAIDAGIACENLNLAVTAAGLATVPCATMDVAALVKALKLTPSQIPVLNNPIGYPANR